MKSYTSLIITEIRTEDPGNRVFSIDWRTLVSTVNPELEEIDKSAITGGINTSEIISKKSEVKVHA